MRVLEIIWKIFFCSFSYLFKFFFFFFFVCVKRLDSVSGCPDSKVATSGRPFSLSRRACLCDLLRGTTSGRHLSSVRTMNPVGLYRIPLRLSPSHFIFFFWCFLSSCAFFLAFYVCSSRALVLFEIYLHPKYVSLPFY
jgi:hypothetical protein